MAASIEAEQRNYSYRDVKKQVNANGIEFHWTLSGTNTGTNGIGKKVKISGFELWQMDNNGLIKQSKGSFDTEDYHRQIKNGFENQFPNQLSGGMQQRVGLARALATNSDIMLMDEAFSALDPLIRSDMQDLLLALQKELHKTIIFITHDLDEALKIGDQIAILNGGELVQHGTPQDIIMNPADNYVKDFVKKVNRSHVLQTKSVMTDQKPSKGSKSIAVSDMDSIDSALCEMLRENADCCIIQDSSGLDVGYLNKKDIAEVVKPLES